MRPQGMRHSQRGVVLPSPVMMLSIVAVVMAAAAFLFTRGGDTTEREIAPVADGQTSAPVVTDTPTVTATPSKTPKPIVRKKVPVEVYNNTSTKGLAGEVGDRAATIGWQVVGADNWYGSVEATTVYYPAKLKRAAKQLALDLGIKRTAKAVDPMKLDRLTIILTGPLE